MNKSIKKYQTLFHSFIIKQESILRWFSGNWMESKCLCSLCSLVKRGSQMGMSCSYSPRSTRRPLLPKCPEREQPRRRERTGGKHTANSLLGIVCLRLSLSLMFQKTAWESQEHVTHFRNALSLSSVNVIHILRSELSLNAFILEKKSWHRHIDSWCSCRRWRFKSSSLSHKYFQLVMSGLRTNHSFEQVLLLNWF